MRKEDIKIGQELRITGKKYGCMNTTCYECEYHKSHRIIVTDLYAHNDDSERISGKSKDGKNHCFFNPEDLSPIITNYQTLKRMSKL